MQSQIFKCTFRKIRILKMVKGFENTTMYALNKRFEKLCGYINH